MRSTVKEQHRRQELREVTTMNATPLPVQLALLVKRRDGQEELDCILHTCACAHSHLHDGLPCTEQTMCAHEGPPLSIVLDLNIGYR